jgi:uncharacterized membrane protein
VLKNATANHEVTEMSFAPLLDATHPIPIHGIAALICLIFGLAQLLMRKGTTLHRRLGWVWAVLMALVAVSGLFIWELRLFWLFSPIHLLSLLTLWAFGQGHSRCTTGPYRRPQTRDDTTLRFGTRNYRSIHLLSGADHVSGLVWNTLRIPMS